MKPLMGKHETLLKRENMKPEQVNSEFVPPPPLTTPGKLKVNAKQCKAMQSNAKQCKATQSINAKQYKAVQCNAMQSNAKQYKAI